jgi:hypothetical protein
MTNPEQEMDTERRSHVAPLNRTELLQFIKSLGLEVHPGAPTDLLQDMVLDRIDPAIYSCEVNPVNDWRLGLIRFIDDHWMKLRPQLKCPAQHMKSKDPKLANPMPCFGCTDMQVLFCVQQAATLNPRSLHLIAERKPTR